MKHILIFLSVLPIFSCTDNNECCSTINAEFFLKAVGSDGVNLVTEDLLLDIRLYYIDENEIKQLYFNENWDNPNSMHIWSNKGENLLVVNPPIPSNNESTITTLVEWGKSGMLPDTFYINYNVQGNSLYMNEIIFDDKVICSQSSGCIVEIMK